MVTKIFELIKFIQLKLPNSHFMLLHPLISNNAKGRRFKPGLGQCVFEDFCCMLTYVQFFKENYDDVLPQHIRKIK